MATQNHLTQSDSEKSLDPSVQPLALPHGTHAHIFKPLHSIPTGDNYTGGNLTPPTHLARYSPHHGGDNYPRGIQHSLRIILKHTYIYCYNDNDSASLQWVYCTCFNNYHCKQHSFMFQEETHLFLK